MDVSLATSVVFLHVATAFVFVGGLIGRWIVLGRDGEPTSVRSTHSSPSPIPSRGS